MYWKSTYDKGDIYMERHQQFWQQFAQSGDPKAYLAYKQSRSSLGQEAPIRKHNADN